MRALYSHRDYVGRLHKEDGPALAFEDGSQMWYKHGLVHRVGGPAITGKRQCMKRDDQLMDGTWAIQSCVVKSLEWFVNGLRHRTDGPAVERDDLIFEYWTNGQRLHEDEFYLYVDTTNGDVLVPPGKKLAYNKYGVFTRSG